MSTETKPKRVITPLLIDTNTAAAYLSLQPQTLREWSSNGSGKIIPVKIGNRLRWRLADVQKLAGV